MIKLVASDVDGTLLDSHERLSEKTIQAIDKLHDKNIIFVLASGRGYYETSIVRDKLKHNIGCIGFNGAYYCNEHGEPIINHYIDDDTLEYLFQLGKDNGLDIFFCTEERSYIYNYQAFIDRSNLAYQRKFNVSMDEAIKLRQENFSSPMDTPMTSLSEIREKVLKVGYFFCTQDEVDFLEKTIRKNDELSVSTNPIFKNVEVTVKCATKGKMIKEVCEYLGIKDDEVLCFGDGDNDLDMFKYFPNSYAMANSNENIKKISKLQAPSNDEDGVAVIIEKILEEQDNA